MELSLYNQRKHDPNDPDDLPIWAPISRPSLMMCLYVIPPLMTAISVAEIALRAAAPRRGREANFVRWTDEERDGFMADWPQSLYPHEDELPIASAALSIAVSLLVLGLAVDVAKNGPIKVCVAGTCGLKVSVPRGSGAGPQVRVEPIDASVC